MDQHDIILIAAEPWENYTWRRRHHVAWALSKKNKVLFVEPPYSVLSPFRNKHISWKQLFNLGRLKHQGRNLYSYSPFKLLPLSLPFSERFNLDAINKKIIFYKLKRFAKSLEIKNPILWVFFSDKQYDYFGLFKEAIVVGDLYDKFGAPSWEGMSRKEIQYLLQRQDNIMRNADIVFTVSQLLCDEFKLLHKKTYLVQNGVDFEYFDNYDDKHNLNNTRFNDIKGPVLAFLGMMHYIVDYELLNYITESNSKWTLLLIGHKNINSEEDKKQFDMLLSRENVIYMGRINKEEIPYYLNLADVCLLPMKKIDLNKYADPLKLWEYFAAGKPVVAVDQGTSCEQPDLIRLANSKEEFVRNISQALRKDINDDRVNRRKIIAKENTWENRVKQMLAIIEESL